MHVPKWGSQLLEQQVSFSDAEVAQDAQSVIVSSDPVATRKAKMQDRCAVSSCLAIPVFQGKPHGCMLDGPLF